ncbi:MAG: OmpA family protein [Candidatus Thiodiazotropha sp. (ex Lucinoma aequizonata)]|nr:OmpA family protein [Candidatus Thiodiazotropha sp. (ex Lucinoma aequizonata)]MCU7903081.1 OmpA family protein [Candidatus Thiodiazotropha sp. (ex Lucinoma aequizonata)]
MTPLLISSNAMAEKGLAYDSAEKVWRTGYSECWTSPYRDKIPSDTSCYGEPAPAMAERDADNDGVVDSKDQCHGTAAGTKVDEKGCALDSDGDGVVDGSDKCPNTPQGAKIDAMGCELDSDGDGVVDSKDACPNTPAFTTVNATGCAEQITLQGVRFKLNSDRIGSEYVATLDHDAASLKARSDVKSVEVTGHTDSTGAADYNQSLSEKRAKAVADYLVSQGVNGAIFTTNGMGESSPVADNSTAEGRAQNRRVELKLD